jgi:hypothetical protein
VSECGGLARTHCGSVARLSRPPQPQCLSASVPQCLLSEWGSGEEGGGSEEGEEVELWEMS